MHSPLKEQHGTEALAREMLDHLQATTQAAVQRHGSTPAPALDWLTTEWPVALVFNGVSHAVMMATPVDLEDFALGFALSEGVIDSPSDWRGMDVHATPQGCELHIEIATACFERLRAKRRLLAGPSGCGLCGSDSLEALGAVPSRGSGAAALDAPVVPGAPGPDLRTLLRAMAAMPALQVHNARTGSLHAAAWANAQGDIVALCEDVGRHNALDKLFGQLARSRMAAGGFGGPAAGSVGRTAAGSFSPTGADSSGPEAADGFVVMSSRASYELVRKCVQMQSRLSIGALATVSAPTSLAVQLARSAGLGLWGLCRGSSAVQYAPVARVQGSSAGA